MGSFSLKSEDVEIDDPLDIANTFNNFFCYNCIKIKRANSKFKFQKN